MSNLNQQVQYLFQLSVYQALQFDVEMIRSRIQTWKTAYFVSAFCMVAAVVGLIVDSVGSAAIFFSMSGLLALAASFGLYRDKRALPVAEAQMREALRELLAITKQA